MSYNYDVFVSYARAFGVDRWVKNYFEPLLTQKLAQELPHNPRVFVDFGMHTGIIWKAKIQDALQKATIVVAILNPPYFRSKWCQAEWLTMEKRESDVRSGELIYPITIGDGKHFPEEASARIQKSFHEYFVDSAAFGQSPAFIDFEKDMRAVAKEVANLIAGAPPWSGSWAVLDPDSIKPYPLQGADGFESL